MTSEKTMKEETQEEMETTVTKETVQKPAIKAEEKARESKEETKENQGIEEIKEIIELEENRKRFWYRMQGGIKGTLYGIWEFFRHPKKTLKRFYKNKGLIVYLVAILAGVVGAIAAWFFSNYISIMRILFYGLMFNNAGSIGRIALIILLPTIAAAVTAPILNKWAPEAKGHGIPEVMESILYKDGYIKTTTPYLKMSLSGICIGGGLSLGREGPIAQIGGGFSSFLGRHLGLKGRYIRTVVVCGLVAGIAATFNAPIGGALFGLEILIISLSADQLIPVILSSMIATIIGRFILERRAQPVFSLPSELTEIEFSDYIPYLHWFLLLGVLAGFVALFYTKAIGLVEQLVHKIHRVHPVLWPIAGGLLTGLLGLISPKEGNRQLNFSPLGNEQPVISIDNVNGIPRIFGVGYETITDLFYNKPQTDSWSIFGGGIFVVIILLVLLKILATGFSVGTGNSGGVFAPGLFIGASTGYLFAIGVDSLDPAITLSSQDIALFTLAGLASVFAGSSRAVLTMIFMASEMTSSYYTFIPLMLTCTISFFINKLTMKSNIYTQKLELRGLDVTLAGPTDILETYKVKDIMTTNVICVPKDMRMHEFDSLVKTMDHLGYPIINMEGKFLGMITTTHLKEALSTNQMDKTVYEIGEKDPYVLFPNETLDQAMSLLFRSEIGRIAVLDSPETRNLVGIISNSDILRGLEMQKLKDLEERRYADQKLAELELRLVQKTIEKYPELAEKVKVIKREDVNRIIEKDLLNFLREKCAVNTLKEKIEEEYQAVIQKKKKAPKKKGKAAK
ncbi:hypothetical protein DRO91_02425 [Candidatus Heimdallarchaeota archaeon]|nr:MAG: hypothetical protein DRO63_04020 [Candidatus Gerdarchaeota archaeon]RLI71843.1 MAG: hypothetical protein DRP02_03545 [Candidatus Gerdarchaeota archaeon]RLI73666.1 MAG: hypothetical protein DRO91_02425 [Candidatus Heimdallarchaeota archaeon]